MLKHDELRFISSHLCHKKFDIKFKILYSDTSANEDNSFRNHIR